MSHITHVEYGIYLASVGTEMRKQNKSLQDIIDPSTPEEKTKILKSMTSQGMSSSRAPEVFEVGWSFMRSANRRTYPNRGLAVKADEAQDEDEF